MYRFYNKFEHNKFVLGQEIDPAFVDQPLYNQARGYGSYVVVAVGILIVQQAMLIPTTPGIFGFIKLK